jgi:hypothetical protein
MPGVAEQLGPIDLAVASIGSGSGQAGFERISRVGRALSSICSAAPCWPEALQFHRATPGQPDLRVVDRWC